jgi:hypothetical protein
MRSLDVRGTWVVLRVLACAVVPLLSSCSPAPMAPDDSFTVTGFRQGLLSIDANDESHVSTEGNSFPYIENGPCVVAGQARQCMWYGHEISWKSRNTVTKLDCTFETSDAFVSANAASKAGTASKVNHLTLELQGLSGSHTDGGYVAFGHFGNTGRPPIQETESCSYKGREVLKYDFTIYFLPDKTPPGNNGEVPH